MEIFGFRSGDSFLRDINSATNRSNQRSSFLFPLGLVGFANHIVPIQRIKELYSWKGLQGSSTPTSCNAGIFCPT